MAITDADQLVEVEWRLIEDASLSSGLWSLAEIASLFNQRQSRFNRDTFLLLAQVPLAVGSGTTVVALPDDWIATQRVSWRSAAGIFSQVDRSDRYSNYALQPGGNKPLLYDDHAAGPRTLELYPVPTGDGVISLLYAAVTSTLNFVLAADIFDLPDDFVPYVTYGVLADLLSKDGRAQDLGRAGYCDRRYEEGVGLAALFLGGFV